MYTHRGSTGCLYRSWESPLIFENSSEPYIQFVSIDAPFGTIGYAKDDYANVRVTGSSDSSAKSTIGSLAERDEVGIYNPDYFNEGTFTVGTNYIIHPPIEDDGINSHLNLKFAGSTHIPYRDVRITVPGQDVEQIYVYPPTLTAEKTGTTYTITGSAAENENIAVEMLGPTGGFAQIPGFRSKATDLQGKTASGSFWYNLPYTVSSILNVLAKIGVLLVPFLLLLIYYRYGRERQFTVTTYLSTIPNPALKPWQVNLLFRSDPLDFDVDGYYATLLELHRRKLIVLTEKRREKDLL